MKLIKRILLPVVLLAAWSPAALAQNDAAGTTASANVITDLFVGNKTNALNFGNILVGSSKYLAAGSPDGSFVDATASGTGGSVDGVTGGEELGFISIKTNGVVDIDVRLPGSLLSTTSSAELDVDWSYDGQGNTSSWNVLAVTSSDYTDGSAPTTYFDDIIAAQNLWTQYGTSSGGPNIDPDQLIDIGEAGGEIFVIVGGQVNATTTQPTEVYQESIEVRVYLID